MKCPLTKNKNCKKDECPWWVELTINKGQNGEHEQGRCAIAWFPTLLIEIRVATERKTNQTLTGKE